jgi:hypothetical protein
LSLLPGGIKGDSETLILFFDGDPVRVCLTDEVGDAGDSETVARARPDLGAEWTNGVGGSRDFDLGKVGRRGDCDCVER